MGLRCKFRCGFIGSVHPNWDGTADGRRVILDAVKDPTIPEGERFTRLTPRGELNVVIDNPEALARLRVGYNYYVELTPAD